MAPCMAPQSTWELAHFLRGTIGTMLRRIVTKFYVETAFCVRDPCQQTESRFIGFPFRLQQTHHVAAGTRRARHQQPFTVQTTIKHNNKCVLNRVASAFDWF